MSRFTVFTFGISTSGRIIDANANMPLAVRIAQGDFTHRDDVDFDNAQEVKDVIKNWAVWGNIHTVVEYERVGDELRVFSVENRRDGHIVFPMPIVARSQSNQDEANVSRFTVFTFGIGTTGRVRHANANMPLAMRIAQGDFDHRADVDFENAQKVKDVIGRWSVWNTMHTVVEYRKEGDEFKVLSVENDRDGRIVFPLPIAARMQQRQAYIANFFDPSLPRANSFNNDDESKNNNNKPRAV